MRKGALPSEQPPVNQNMVSILLYFFEVNVGDFTIIAFAFGSLLVGFFSCLGLPG